ncbi:MAG: Eco57I restriction-modification methylase domain-containing protein [Alphaproteobacteria bacterium]|nr:Eco57I restriction-modification methylase domain-containing protein [Alphaproteobacteria bacterium]
MQAEVAKKLIEETFNKPFDLSRFKTFIRELTKGYEERNSSSIIPDNFKEGIKSAYRIGKIKDDKGNEIDLVAVTLQKEVSLDRARTLQRNYIARYLKGHGKEAALVAFVAPDSGSWRFSLVRRELGIKLNTKGKAKAFDEISPARRFSFLVGQGEKTHTAKRQLMPLLESDSRPSLVSLEKAFNIETVTDEFFDEYRELFGKVKDQIDDHLKGNPKAKKHFEEREISSADFAKRLLGQIVFLYFLQKKGWLGVPKGKKWGEGSRAFLRDLYDKAKSQKQNFFNEYLEKLFYEALNRDHSDIDHYHTIFDSRIPFLNGGLFDAYHDYDWHSVDIELPNEIFSKLGKSLFSADGVGILDVFDRYNFTVAEDEPLEREVAIDPEMLGKVFERLLPANERGDKGTFYTPREIVHYMCQESLIAYLGANIEGLDKTEVEDFIRYGDLMLEHDAKVLRDGSNATYKDVFLGKTIQDNLQAVDDALAQVKVCDPAIGSGAFPVGMMMEIVRARKVLALYCGGDISNYNLKRDTIHNSLYGVDLDPGAIEIAKLRLWLSLVVDEDSFDNIQALPNLDYKIMQGNSLLQSYEGIKLFKENLLKTHDNAVRRKKQLQEELNNLRNTLQTLKANASFAMSPNQTKALEEEIKKKAGDIKKLETTSKEQAPSLLSIESKAGELAEHLKKLHADFFRSASPSDKKKIRGRIEELEWQLIETSLKEQSKTAKLTEIQKLQKANVKPYFLWKLHFSDVFAGGDGGFDIVIANPPYVRQEKIRDQKLGFKIEFPDFFKGTADLYTYFYRRGVEILKPKGHLCFIAPNKFFKAGYGENLRIMMTEQVRLLKVLDFGELPVFDAGTDPSIILFQKEKPTTKIDFAAIKRKEDLNDLVSCIKKSSKEIFVADLATTGWNFSSGADKDLLRKLDKVGIPLGKYANGQFYYGIKTGLNEAFVIDGTTKKRLIEEDANSKEVIKPWLRGRDVKRWYSNNSDLWLIYLPWHFPLQMSADISGPSNKAEEAFKKRYPAIYKYISGFKGELLKRNQDEVGVRYEWYALQRWGADYWQEFEKPKIVYADIAKLMRATYDENSVYCGNTMYFLPTEDLSILGILNSTVFDWYARHKFQPLGDPWNGGRMRFIAQFMETFPMPPAKNRDKVAKLVKSVLAKKKENPDTNVTELEKSIDAEVYKLYDLSEDDVFLIESATRDAQKKAA